MLERTESPEHTPRPNENCLAEVRLFDVYDVCRPMIIPYEKDGLIAAYSPAGVLHFIPHSGTDERFTINLRTDLSKNTDPNWLAAVNKLVAHIDKNIAEGTPDFRSIPKGYPEVEAIFGYYLIPENQSELTTLLDKKYNGSWYIMQKTYVGEKDIQKKSFLFQVDDVSYLFEPDQESWFIYQRPLGLPLPRLGKMPYRMHIRTDYYQPDSHTIQKTKWSMKFDERSGNYYRSKASSHSTTKGDAIFYPIDARSAHQILELRQPEIDPYIDRPFGREHALLSAAFDVLQDTKWSQNTGNEELLPKDYAVIIDRLVEHFGYDFFQEAAWQTCIRHLSKINFDDILKTGLLDGIVYTQTMSEQWLNTIGRLTGYFSTLNNRSSALNKIHAKPLFAEINFWQAIRQNYPSMYAVLTGRYLEISDSYKIEMPGSTILLHPRKFLQTLYPETYDFLLADNPQFALPENTRMIYIVM